MRNVFDQYGQPENRVTHSLATALDRDPKLLRRFVRQIASLERPRGARLQILEQGFPEGPTLSEDESSRRGLPDVCIHDQGNWTLLIEVKVTAALPKDQLRRHLATARRKGFSDCHLLLLTADEEWTRPLPECCEWVSWPRIYEWLRQQSARSEWAGMAAEYLEVAEEQLVGEKKSMDGSLTTFTGFRFGSENPYSYGEAKLVLGQALRELRKRKDLVAKLGMDPQGSGRPAITGRDAPSVWDFLPLRVARGSKQFTHYPHLTLGVNRDGVTAQATFPNGLNRSYRRSLKALSRTEFHRVIGDVERNMRPIVRRAPGAVPWFVGLQRHYLSQRSQPIVDAKLEFDLRTVVLRSDRPDSRVKTQTAWLDAAHDALQSGGANYQIAVGLSLQYARCATAATPRAIDLVAGAWLACKPILDAVRS